MGGPTHKWSYSKHLQKWISYKYLMNIFTNNKFQKDKDVYENQNSMR